MRVLIHCEGFLLPFLKPKNNQAGVITKEFSSKSEEIDPGLKASAHELLAAIHKDDAIAVAKILKSIFEILDAEPHVEGQHINE